MPLKASFSSSPWCPLCPNLMPCGDCGRGDPAFCFPLGTAGDGVEHTEPGGGDHSGLCRATRAAENPPRVRTGRGGCRAQAPTCLSEGETEGNAAAGGNDEMRSSPWLLLLCESTLSVPVRRSHCEGPRGGSGCCGWEQEGGMGMRM